MFVDVADVQRMDHEGEAVHAPEAVGVDDARLERQLGDDLQVIVLEDAVRVLAGGGDDHRVEQVRAQHMVVHERRAVDDHVHALVAELLDALAGSGQFAPATDMKVVVSITLAGQAPIQARFTPLEKPKSSAN